MNLDKLNDLRGRFENHMNLPQEDMLELFAFAEATLTAAVAPKATAKPKAKEAVDTVVAQD